jgi:hypothetical protein
MALVSPLSQTTFSTSATPSEISVLFYIMTASTQEPRTGLLVSVQTYHLKCTVLKAFLLTKFRLCWSLKDIRKNGLAVKPGQIIL